MPISEHVGKADWKTEKHVPVIECPDKIAPDQIFDVTVMIGKEIAHPNTTAHHIRW
ncbi:MAG TPA: Neelaredoxin, partial [Thermoplasmata archaeon]|nr:Neelaredoxin [Thermoplasmata archaeon]